MKYKNNHKNTQGNVLFLILIAVALFAALSYAVTSSSKGGGSGISADKAKISAAQILQFGSLVEQAVTRLQLMNGCSDSEIDFETPEVIFSVNPQNLKGNTCKVFHPDGGGVAYIGVQKQWLATDPGGYTPNPNGIQFTGYGELSFVTQNTVEDVGINDCVTSIINCPGGEIVMFMPFVDDAVCTAFNKNQKIVSQTVPGVLGSKLEALFLSQQICCPLDSVRHVSQQPVPMHNLV